MYPISKKKLAGWLLIPGIILGFAIAASLFMISPLFSVEQTTAPVVHEAGRKPQFTPSDFLTGDSWIVNLSYVDASAVNHKKVGEYPVHIYHGFEKHTATVQVVDTTAPTISGSVSSITIQKGDSVTVNTIGMKAEDNTGIDRLLFHHVVAEKIHVAPEENNNPEHISNLFLEGRDLWTKEYTFDHGGIYTLSVSAMDAYNNQTQYSVQVVVEEAPVIDVVSDIYLALGQTVNFYDYIDAWDFLDENYSAKDVKVDTSAIDTTKTGEYTVNYTATDSYGLSSQASTVVHLRTRAELQNLINTHQIDKDNYIIIGAYNPYDSGYYDKNDTDFIQDAMRPAIVHIDNDDNDTFGSGYIIKIDQQFITIATNAHVIDGDYSPEIFFYDGTSCEGIVVASDPREDIAFLRIPIDMHSADSALPFSYVQTLRTVHINEGYWKKLVNDEKLAICYTCVDTEGNIWYETEGFMVYKTVVRTWNEYEDINECIISMAPVGGTSGSAIFDGYGRLIAMVRGYTTYYNDDGSTYVETVAVPLIEILDYYQTIFHEKLHYQ